MAIHPFVRFALANLLATTLLSGVARGQEIELKNDGFSPGQPVAFQAGFIAGEMAASRFVPPAGSWRVNRVQFLFGGAEGIHDITLRVWNDPAGASSPGTEYYAADYSVIGSNTDLQEIDLTAQNVDVTGPFRVGMEFHQAGLPCVASDQDGNFQPLRDYLFAQGFGWAESHVFGVSGDWVIRAFVENPLTAVGDPDRPTLAISLAGTNPVRGSALRLIITLPSRAPARLELIDGRPPRGVTCAGSARLGPTRRRSRRRGSRAGRVHGAVGPGGTLEHGAGRDHSVAPRQHTGAIAGSVA